MAIELLLALALLFIAAGNAFAFYIYHKTVKNLTDKLMSRSPEDMLILSDETRKKEPDVMTIPADDQDIIPLDNVSAEEILEAAVKENDGNR